MDRFDETCVELLGSVSERWPKPSSLAAEEQLARLAQGAPQDDLDVEPYREQLADMLASGFDHGQLQQRIGSLLDITSVRTSEGDVSIEFVDESGYPHRAVFVAEGREWRLLTLSEACPSCMNGAVMDPQVCLLCEGKGWQS